MRLSWYTFLIASSLSVAPAVVAENSGDSSVESGWRLKSQRVIAVDGSDAGNSADLHSYVRIIEAGTGDEPRMLISCQITCRGKYSMNMGFQLDPTNSFEDNPTRKHNIINRSAKLSFGKKSQDGTLVLSP